MSVDTRLTMERKQRLRGPGGLVLELDAGEIYPDDPGQGTPCMLSLGSDCGTLACALGEGELSHEGTRLTGRQMVWLEDLEQPVNCWLAARVKIAREGGAL